MNLLVFIFYFKLSVYVVGKFFIFWLIIEFVFLDCGILVNIFWLLFNYFVNLKLFFIGNFFSCEGSFIVIFGEFIDFIKLLIYLFFFMVWVVIGLNFD